MAVDGTWDHEPPTPLDVAGSVVVVRMQTTSTTLVTIEHQPRVASTPTTSEPNGLGATAPRSADRAERLAPSRDGAPLRRLTWPLRARPIGAADQPLDDPAHQSTRAASLQSRSRSSNSRVSSEEHVHREEHAVSPVSEHPAKVVEALDAQRLGTAERGEPLLDFVDEGTDLSCVARRGHHEEVGDREQIADREHHRVGLGLRRCGPRRGNSPRRGLFASVRPHGHLPISEGTSAPGGSATRSLPTTIVMSVVSSPDGACTTFTFPSIAADELDEGLRCDGRIGDGGASDAEPGRVADHADLGTRIREALRDRRRDRTGPVPLSTFTVMRSSVAPAIGYGTAFVSINRASRGVDRQGLVTVDPVRRNDRQRRGRDLPRRQTTQVAAEARTGLARHDPGTSLAARILAIQASQTSWAALEAGHLRAFRVGGSEVLGNLVGAQHERPLGELVARGGLHGDGVVDLDRAGGLEERDELGVVELDRLGEPQAELRGDPCAGGPAESRWIISP